MHDGVHGRVHQHLNAAASLLAFACMLLENMDLDQVMFLLIPSSKSCLHFRGQQQSIKQCLQNGGSLYT